MSKQETTRKMENITIKGKSYPFYMTMGALLIYKRMTGKEMSKVENPNIEDTMEIIYSIVKAASQANDIEFPYNDVVDFSCQLTPEQLSSISIN